MNLSRVVVVMRRDIQPTSFLTLNTLPSRCSNVVYKWFKFNLESEHGIGAELETGESRVSPITLMTKNYQRRAVSE